MAEPGPIIGPATPPSMANAFIVSDGNLAVVTAAALLSYP